MSLSKIAKKHLGQHFLIDENTKNRIIDAAGLSADDAVLEIGPGLGALTQMILKTGAGVHAIEKDSALIPQLKQKVDSKNFHLIEADFLKHDLSRLPSISKVLGNIPYNISSPIIEKLITCRSKFQDIFLTTQLEFAQRLTAHPGTKDYGALTCFIQYYADVKILFKISPNCFRPVPKVTSCFLEIHFREPELKAQNEDLLFKITRAAFQQRRKKIENALAGISEKKTIEKTLDALKIKKGSRADHVSLEDYIRLTNSINQTLLFPDCPTPKTSA